MKRVLGICGSASAISSNLELLQVISVEFSEHVELKIYDGLPKLPLFTPDRLKAGVPASVSELKSAVSQADAVIICTPEYLHNIPAVLKNALEWMTESGELANKPVLPITFTPAPPRGEYAMKSLLQSLVASKAKVVAEMPLYQNEIRDQSGRMVLNDEHRFILLEALNLL